MMTLAIVFLFAAIFGTSAKDFSDLQSSFFQRFSCPPSSLACLYSQTNFQGEWEIGNEISKSDAASSCVPIGLSTGIASVRFNGSCLHLYDSLSCDHVVLTVRSPPSSKKNELQVKQLPSWETSQQFQMYSKKNGQKGYKSSWYDEKMESSLDSKVVAWAWSICAPESLEKKLDDAVPDRTLSTTSPLAKLDSFVHYDNESEFQAFDAGPGPEGRSRRVKRLTCNIKNFAKKFLTRKQLEKAVAAALKSTDQSITNPLIKEKKSIIENDVTRQRTEVGETSRVIDTEDVAKSKKEDPAETPAKEQDEMIQVEKKTVKEQVKAFFRRIGSPFVRLFSTKSRQEQAAKTENAGKKSKKEKKEKISFATSPELAMTLSENKGFQEILKMIIEGKSIDEITKIPLNSIFGKATKDVEVNYNVFLRDVDATKKPGTKPYEADSGLFKLDENGKPIQSNVVGRVIQGSMGSPGSSDLSVQNHLLVANLVYNVPQKTSPTNAVRKLLQNLRKQLNHGNQAAHIVAALSGGLNNDISNFLSINSKLNQGQLKALEKNAYNFLGEITKVNPDLRLRVLNFNDFPTGSTSPKLVAFAFDVVTSAGTPVKVVSDANGNPITMKGGDLHIFQNTERGKLPVPEADRASAA